MKNKGVFDRKFHCRGPDDHAKAGNNRELIWLNRPAPLAGLTRGEAVHGPPAAALGIAELLSSPSLRSESSQ
jgi:hypothetical protein